VCKDVLYGDILSRRRFVEETFLLDLETGKQFAKTFCTGRKNQGPF
jgi:hypothetical protein